MAVAELIRLVAAAELVAAVAGLVTFCILYSRLAWRVTPTGRQLMTVCAYWAVIIALRVVDQDHLAVVVVPGWLYAVVWAPLPVLAWRWVVLLLRAKHEEESR